MLRLLLIAPACDGEDVGEAWLGFQWARSLSVRHDTTILTYTKRGRTPLSTQLPDARVVAWTEPPLIGRAERFNSLLKPGYVPFYFRARRWIRNALARGEKFDIAHQVAPVAMRYPSPVAGLGVPFVIGPVGGSLTSPEDFRPEERTTAWYVGLRKLDELRIRRDPMLRSTYRAASCVLGIAPYVGRVLVQVPVRRFEVMSDVGLPHLPAAVDRRDRHGDVKLLYVGRLIRTKGARDAIRAMAQLRDLPISLDVAGDGFDRRACEALAHELAVADRIRFHGWVSRPRVEELYQAADAFIFPSYREPGGTVVLEAMSFGLPMIVSDVGGPAYAVDEHCGYRVHPESPGQYASDLADAVRVLAQDPELRHELGHAARRRAEKAGLWDGKVQRLEAIYRSVVADRHCQPLPRQPSCDPGARTG
jgi:glycosyltransferase involved in cell wall biosynthesis